MAITKGCVNVTVLLQRILQPPLLLSPSTLECYPNPKFFTTESSHRRRFYTFARAIGLLSVVCICRIAFLVYNWHQNPDVEQLGVYAVFGAGIVLGFTGVHVYINKLNEACYVVTQRFRLVPVHAKGWPNKKPTKASRASNLLYFDFGIGCALFYFGCSFYQKLLPFSNCCPKCLWIL